MMCIIFQGTSILPLVVGRLLTHNTLSKKLKTSSEATLGAFLRALQSFGIESNHSQGEHPKHVAKFSQLANEWG